MELLYKDATDTISPKRIVREVEKRLWKQIEPHTHSDFYYSVITYSDWLQDFNNPRWDFYNLTSVRKTHRMLRRMLKEAFKVDYIYMFPERHCPDEEHYYEALSLPAKKGCINPEFQIGNIKGKGRFHTNIIMSSIKDERITNPNSKCRKLFKMFDNNLIPINQKKYNSIDNLRYDLINACCKQPDWVNERQLNAVKTQVLERPSDVKRVLHYCMKECYNNGTDFTEVVDFDNSDFNKLDK